MMDDASRTLTPDEPTEPNVVLDHEPSSEPYGLTGIMIAMVLLLFAHIFALRIGLPLHMRDLLNALAIATGACAYLFLLIFRPRLNPLGLCMLASALGMLFSLPAEQVLITPWGSWDGAFFFLLRLAVALVLGLVLAVQLDARRHPRMLIGISFLLVFVVVNVYFHVGAR